MVVVIVGGDFGWCRPYVAYSGGDCWVWCGECGRRCMVVVIVGGDCGWWCIVVVIVGGDVVNVVGGAWWWWLWEVSWWGKCGWWCMVVHGDCKWWLLLVVGLHGCGDYKWWCGACGCWCMMVVIFGIMVLWLRVVIMTDGGVRAGQF